MVYHGYELNVAKSDMKEHHERAVRENQIRELKAARRGNFSLWRRLTMFFRRSNLNSSYIPLHPSEKK